MIILNLIQNSKLFKIKMIFLFLMLTNKTITLEDLGD